MPHLSYIPHQSDCISKKSDVSNIFHDPVLLFLGQYVITFDSVCYNHLIFIYYWDYFMMEEERRVTKTRIMTNPYGKSLICKSIK